MRSSVLCWNVLCRQVAWEALEPIEPWFSTFLKLRPFTTVLHSMVIPSLKTLSLWLHICNLATVTRRNVNIYVFWWSYVTLWKDRLTLRSRDSQVENHSHRPWMRLRTQELSIFISSFLIFFFFSPVHSSLTFPYHFFSFSWSGCMYLPISLSLGGGLRWVIFFLKKTQDRTRERLHCKVHPL